MSNNMIKMPIATVKMLAQMFTTENGGVNVSTILDDLGGNRDLNTINLGLLLKGNKIEVPETMYVIGSNRISVLKLIHASVLKDRVSYKSYTFRKQDDGSWKQDSYVSTGSYDFEDWYNRDQKLPNDVVLPEIIESND